MKLTELQNTDPVSSDIESYANQLLCLALDIGEGMLKCGAEVHRVENAIERICYAYGAEHVEVFAITSLIVASVRMKDNSYSSQVRRLYGSSYSFSRLEDLNALSRRICKETPSLEEVNELIHRIKARRAYSFWLYLLGGCGSAAAFTLFFGGNWSDFFVAFFLGAVVVVIDWRLPAYINQLVKQFLTAFVAGSLAYLSVYLGVGSHVDSIIIGTIMLFIPGLAFGNALRDLLWGDIMAGIMKTVQSCLSAMMIAFGFMLSAMLMGELGWLRSSEPVSASATVQLISSFFATATYAMLFRTRVKYLPAVALCGLLTYSIYLLVITLGLSPFFAALFASVFTSAFSELCARVQRAPSIIFSFAGAVPIVPGSGLYYAMDALLFGKNELVYSNFKWTMMVGAGIALGTLLVSILVNVLSRWKQARTSENP
ncbi:MAG: threonine/serine exporter family protein [Clostridia bacterium]|nr:threonine/serine exporter family protein [Clostridia bacterium]MBQ3014726.1 threonine/serine exporter family protein [Clostridia bacterium]